MCCVILNNRPVVSRRHNGFTLMEVMVALMIIGLTLGVLLRAASDSINNAGILRNMTIAQWVAENKLAELRIQGTLNPGTAKSGVTEMLNLSWSWRIGFTKTPDPNVKQITVKVYAGKKIDPDKATPAAEVNSFLYHPNSVPGL